VKKSRKIYPLSNRVKLTGILQKLPPGGRKNYLEIEGMYHAGRGGLNPTEVVGAAIGQRVRISGKILPAVAGIFSGTR
jgi:hypothetical protein